MNIVTDASATGVAGIISQGIDWKTARIAAFFSAKLNSAQQNYGVPEQELLAGVETMCRHRDILQGCPFQWFTDHKGLIHLLQQKNLTGRQARWMKLVSEFDFEVVHVAGTENVRADALSRLYAFNAPGTVRAASEFVANDETAVTTHLNSLEFTSPLLVGLEAASISPRNALLSALQPSRVTSEPAETSKSFAKQFVKGKRRFVLKGPHPSDERIEGESEKENVPPTPFRNVADGQDDTASFVKEADKAGPSDQNDQNNATLIELLCGKLKTEHVDSDLLDAIRDG